MYQIEAPTGKTLNDYYKDYHQCIIDGVDYFLAGNTVPLELGDNKQVKLDVGVEAGSPSDAFLKMLKKPARLRHLMTCRPDDLPAIIGYVKNMFTPYTEVLATNKLTLPVYNKFYGGLKRIDHFFTIMHNIFVERVFDGKDINNNPVFDKLKFNQCVDLTICPYCGAEDISVRNVVRKNVTHHAKADVDHFLPKSKYPYLAMSFSNLIPCSEVCNRQLKRTMDPLVDLSPVRYRLQNPYCFDFNSVEFSYDFDNTSYHSKDAYQVKVSYPKDAILAEGYNHWLGIDSLYGGKRNLIVDMYKQMAGISQVYQNWLVGMGVKSSNVKMAQPSLDLVFGYEYNEENSRLQPYFKFKHDIALQLIQDGGCGWPW